MGLRLRTGANRTTIIPFYLAVIAILITCAIAPRNAKKFAETHIFKQKYTIFLRPGVKNQVGRALEEFHLLVSICWESSGDVYLRISAHFFNFRFFLLLFLLFTLDILRLDRFRICKKHKIYKSSSLAVSAPKFS